MSLESKVVIITGAAQGLGEVLSYKVANSGGKVALVDVSDKAFQVKKSIDEQAGDFASHR